MMHVAVTDRRQKERKIIPRSIDLVGVAGFDPTAPRSQSECATKLRHTPVHRLVRSAAYAMTRIACHPPLAFTSKRQPVRLGHLASAGHAGVAQWQSPSLPSWLCGFDSRRPLHLICLETQVETCFLILT